jgi:hypothetical protein
MRSRGREAPGGVGIGSARASFRKPILTRFAVLFLFFAVSASAQMNPSQTARDVSSPPSESTETGPAPDGPPTVGIDSNPARTESDPAGAIVRREYQVALFYQLLAQDTYGLNREVLTRNIEVLESQRSEDLWYVISLLEAEYQRSRSDLLAGHISRLRQKAAVERLSRRSRPAATEAVEPAQPIQRERETSSGLGVFWWLVALAFFTVPVCRWAHAWGRKWGLYLVGCLIFTPFVTAIILLIEGRNRAATHTKCPRCAEWVKREATVCRYCNSTLRQLDPNDQAVQALIQTYGRGDRH